MRTVQYTSDVKFLVEIPEGKTEQDALSAIETLQDEYAAKLAALGAAGFTAYGCTVLTDGIISTGRVG